MTRLLRNVLLVPALALAVAAPLAAQSKRPDGWKVRTDRPGADETKLSFEHMPPGFHVTSGPSAILYNPATQAKGDFTLESKIHLFKATSNHAEAFGVFIGGKALEGEAQQYTYFVINNDGKFLIKRRDGAKVTDLVPWTPAPAMKRQDGEDPVANVLAITAKGNDVTFALNGTVLATRPRSEVLPDGIVGVRVNHNLNLHVETVALK